jgi:hypothetical protein
MIAPPAVQAQSFAKAILTDITSILFSGRAADENGGMPISIAGVAVTSRCKRSV